jgi:hypothetical protein
MQEGLQALLRMATWFMERALRSKEFTGSR